MSREKISYREQLSDLRWIRRRLEIIDRDKYTCQKCGWICDPMFEGHRVKPMVQIADPKYLEVHHIYYIHGLYAWEYSGDALVTLCSQCHEQEGQKPTITSATASRTAVEEFRALYMELHR